MTAAVGLVKSYLELCGYFVLAELPVRTPTGQGYRDVTDVDILAVRFPHPERKLPRKTARPLEVFLGNDPELRTPEAGIDVIIGEVKEGRARVNPGLRRMETLAFALRRIGCCPEEEIEAAARLIAGRGSQNMQMPGYVPCHMRIVIFAGKGSLTHKPYQVIPLSRCMQFVAQHLAENEPVLRGVQFNESVLRFLMLQQKLDYRPPQ